MGSEGEGQSPPKELLSVIGIAKGNLSVKYRIFALLSMGPLFSEHSFIHFELSLPSSA
jgi:hypothetical protein